MLSLMMVFVGKTSSTESAGGAVLSETLWASLTPITWRFSLRTHCDELATEEKTISGNERVFSYNARPLVR